MIIKHEVLDVIETSNQSQKGFALIEVLMAALVLTVGALGFIRLQSIGLNNSQGSFSRGEGIEIASSMTEFFRSVPRYQRMSSADLGTVMGGTLGGSPVFSVISSSATPKITFASMPGCLSPDKAQDVACLTTMFQNQRQLIQSRLNVNFAPGRAMLCTLVNPANVNQIRVDVIWRDNNNSRDTREPLERANCPASYSGIVNDGTAGTDVQNYVTIFSTI